VLSCTATNSAGIENRTNCENTGATTVNGFGGAAGVSACDSAAEAQSRPSATMAANVFALGWREHRCAFAEARLGKRVWSSPLG
jgi:hypothetical protein